LDPLDEQASEQQAETVAMNFILCKERSRQKVLLRSAAAATKEVLILRKLNKKCERHSGREQKSSSFG